MPVHYINTQDIRRDLTGFLLKLETGQEYVVLHRSKRLVTLNHKSASSHRTGNRGAEAFLEIAAKARNEAKGHVDPRKSFKEMYYKDMASKHDIS